jgi:glucosamine-phosphate N-acetyltransferase
MKHIKIRELKKSDLLKGFDTVLHVINQVEFKPTTISNITKNINTFVYVAEEYFPSKIVGTITLILCYKFGGHLGLIEDVAVLPSHERQKIGSFLVKHALSEADRMGCYKTILLCKDNNVEFYEKNNMDKYQNCMCIKYARYYDKKGNRNR